MYIRHNTSKIIQHQLVSLKKRVNRINIFGSDFQHLKKYLGKRVLRIASGKLTRTINYTEIITEDLVDTLPMFNMMTVAKHYL